MKINRLSLIDSALWALVMYLLLHIPSIEMRVDDLFEQPAPREQPPAASTQRPEPHAQYLKLGKCFHMPREECPAEGGSCKRVGAVAVFCCDLDSARLKEALSTSITQNTTFLHVLNATIDELDLSQAVFRRLASMSFTDGNIENITGEFQPLYFPNGTVMNITDWDSYFNFLSGEEGSSFLADPALSSGNGFGQFPKISPIACLNISNNNLTSAKLPTHRPFAYLYNLTVLDASANNLTEFPLSLLQSNKKISIDLSGNNYLPCKHFQKAMDTNNISLLVTFLQYNQTFCAKDLQFNWFNDTQIVPIDHLKIQKELNTNCRKIQPSDINCSCVFERLELTGDEVINLVAVDCSERHLKDMPTNLPPNTVKLNVSYNNITSLQVVRDDPTYEHLRQLIVDHNDITHIVDLEGTKFIDNFMLFTIGYNKLKTIQTYVLSNRFGTTGPVLSVSGNHIVCDCNAEKMIKPWLQENFKNIPDYKSLECLDGLGPVVTLDESKVCHTPRDWTDYIYYIIGLEVLVLVLLISKVSYDYWIFKTAGYLPWPANKMPRLPCDWLCE